MLKTIMLSIRPEYVDKIISGEKKYEYRTKAANSAIKKIVIYATDPIKKVVAEAEVIMTLSIPTTQLWNYTKDQSGISKDFFDNYFQGRDRAYAYKLGKITVYEKPKELIEFNIKRAPQSFIYLK